MTMFGFLSPATVDLPTLSMPILPSSSLRDAAARANRVRTIDGGAVVSHRGYSDADRTLTVKTRLDEDARAQLMALMRAETEFVFASPDGLFSVAVSQVTGEDPVTVRMLVAERYPDPPGPEPVVWTDRTTAWASDYVSTSWVEFMDTPGWGCYCYLGSNWHRIVPDGGWETDARPSSVELAFFDMTGEWRLKDSGESVIASGTGGGSFPISFGAADIGAMEFRQLDGGGDSYGLLSLIRFS